MTTRFYILLMLFIASCWLTGCEKSNQNPNTTPQVVKKYPTATMLEGVVSNSQGRVKAGRIKVIDENNQPIATAEVQNNGQYQVEIPANTALPILLTFHADASQANAEQLIVAVIDPLVSKYNISPLTTAIANKAKAMGGYTRTHLMIAAEEMVSVPDSNKTSAGWKGDPTTQYGGWH